MSSGTGKVPFLDLGREYAEIADELEPAVLEVLRSTAYVLGPAAARFESQAAEYLGVAHAIGVSSGSDAVLLALAALDVGPGDEVVTTPFTFFATASAIVRLGAQPVFADISPSDFLLDPEAVERVITERTRAIVPVHLYGQCVDPGVFDAIGRKHRIAIVEDAAQAIGGWRAGQGAGTFGDLGCFSFYPTKNLAAVGEAGLVTTGDDRLAERVRVLREQGSATRYEHIELGWNARIDGVQAAALAVKLPHLDGWTASRIAHAERYDKLFRDADLDQTLTLPTVAPDTVHVFHQYVVRAPRRDELLAYMQEQGVGAAIHYPKALHLQPVFESLGYREGDLPESERAAREVLALPIFPQLRPEEQDRVVEVIAAFYGMAARTG